MLINKRFCIRILSVVAAFLSIVFYYSPYVYLEIYSQEIVDHLFYSPLEPMIYISRNAIHFLFGLSLVSYAAIFFNIMGARYIFFISIVADLAATFMSGISAYTGFDLIVLSVSECINGMIILLLTVSVLDE